MVCTQNTILEWYRNADSNQRIETICGLLHLMLPHEIRFIGACLEDRARRDQSNLSDVEKKANDPVEYFLLYAESETVNSLLIKRLIACVSLLNSNNKICADRLYHVLFGLHGRLLPILGSLDIMLRNDVLLLYTMAAYHPAFIFKQRLLLSEMFSTLKLILDKYLVNLETFDLISPQIKTNENHSQTSPIVENINEDKSNFTNIKNSTRKNSNEKLFMSIDQRLNEKDGSRIRHFSAEDYDSISKWLKKIRLHKYTKCLSKYDWNELLSLTDVKLEEEGLAMGARKKFLNEIKSIKISLPQAILSSPPSSCSEYSTPPISPHSNPDVAGNNLKHNLLKPMSELVLSAKLPIANNKRISNKSVTKTSFNNFNNNKNTTTTQLAPKNFNDSNNRINPCENLPKSDWNKNLNNSIEPLSNSHYINNKMLNHCDVIMTNGDVNEDDFMDSLSNDDPDADVTNSTLISDELSPRIYLKKQTINNTYVPIRPQSFVTPIQQIERKFDNDNCTFNTDLDELKNNANAGFKLEVNGYSSDKTDDVMLGKYSHNGLLVTNSQNNFEDQNLNMSINNEGFSNNSVIGGLQATYIINPVNNEQFNPHSGHAPIIYPSTIYSTVMPSNITYDQNMSNLDHPYPPSWSYPNRNGIVRDGESVAPVYIAPPIYVDPAQKSDSMQCLECMAPYCVPSHAITQHPYTLIHMPYPPQDFNMQNMMRPPPPPQFYVRPMMTHMRFMMKMNNEPTCCNCGGQGHDTLSCTDENIDTSLKTASFQLNFESSRDNIN